MNDRTDAGTRATGGEPQEKHELLVIFDRMQELRDALRRVGVVRVVANYEKNSLLVAFLNSQEIPMLPPEPDKTSEDLGNLLALIIKRRCPEGTPRQVHSGTFNWHLGDDTLVHRHTVTFRGL